MYEEMYESCQNSQYMGEEQTCVLYLSVHINPSRFLNKHMITIARLMEPK